MEHYIPVLAHDVAPLVLKPASAQEKVRVYSDGFVTLHDGQDLFAAVDAWGGYYDSEEELEHFAYVLGEPVLTEVTEDGVDRFLVVEFGRIRSFLRAPESPDAPVYVYGSGIVTLAPEDVPFAQMRDWEEEDIWRLEQLAARWDVPILTRPTPEGEEEPDFDEEEDDFYEEEFW